MIAALLFLLAFVSIASGTFTPFAVFLSSSCIVNELAKIRKLWDSTK
jgi:hypothetical protein